MALPPAGVHAFSTLVYETWRLAEDRAYGRAAANVASLALSLPAAALGWAATALRQRRPGHEPVRAT